MVIIIDRNIAYIFRILSIRLQCGLCRHQCRLIGSVERTRYNSCPPPTFSKNDRLFCFSMTFFFDTVHFWIFALYSIHVECTRYNVLIIFSLNRHFHLVDEIRGSYLYLFKYSHPRKHTIILWKFEGKKKRLEGENVFNRKIFQRTKFSKKSIQSRIQRTSQLMYRR